MQILVSIERHLQKEHIYKIEELYLYWFTVYRQFNIFTKVGQMSRSQCQIFWYGSKGLNPRKTHMKYESPMLNNLNVVGKVKFFFATDKHTDGQTDREKNYMPPQSQIEGA